VIPYTAAGPSPNLSSASGVSSATWWRAAQSTLTKSPGPIDPLRRMGAFRASRVPGMSSR